MSTARKPIDPSDREVEAMEAWARLEQMRADRIESIERSQSDSINGEVKRETKRKAQRRQQRAARKRNR